MPKSRKSAKDPLRPKTVRLGKYSTNRPKALPATTVPDAGAEGSLSVVPPSNVEAVPATADKPKKSRQETIKGLAPNSKIRKAALVIIAMRIAGHSDEEIAAALSLSPKTIPSYLYIAGKKGWLNYADPKDRMEFQLQHQVVDNLKTLMDNPDDKIRMNTTIEVAKGTLFKRFGENQGQARQTNVLSIKIETAPEGSPQVLRADAVGGKPAFVEAQLIEAAHES